MLAIDRLDRTVLKTRTSAIAPAYVAVCFAGSVPRYDDA